MNVDVTVEGTGETVGEAKWAALRELEQRHPRLDKSAVQFEVVSEGERGLLGVGYEPARVVAHAPADSLEAVHFDDDSEAAADARGLAQRIMDAIGVEGRADVREDDEAITVTFSGADVALLIGRHGQMIDAVQYLMNAISHRTHGAERKEVVVDAAGYRDRHRARGARDRRPRRARADDRGRAEGRPPAPEGVRGRADGVRGDGAQPLRRRSPGRLTPGCVRSWRRRG